MNALIEYGKILLPASIVLYAVYLTVRTFINKEIELKRLEVRGHSMETILPNRLQAYERICLFLERISPPNLLLRLNSPGYSAREFHKLLLDEIRNEYNHNVSQQIYMSEEVWNMVRNGKEDLVIMINEASAACPAVVIQQVPWSPQGLQRPLERLLNFLFQLCKCMTDGLNFLFQ